MALRMLRTRRRASRWRVRTRGPSHRSAALIAEVAEARAALDRPAARRLHAGGRAEPLRLNEVEALWRDTHTLLLDALRRALRAGDTALPLARRPILFVLARALAEAWPDDVDRSELIARAFRTAGPTRRTARACASRSAACAPW
jgi:hypothetical protein